MYCKNCGNQLGENVMFCDKCGARATVAKPQQQMNVLAIIGFIVACISFLLNFWGIVGIAAVVLSSLGLIQINKNGEKGKKLAIAGIVLGAISIVYAFILLLIVILM